MKPTKFVTCIIFFYAFATCNAQTPEKVTIQNPVSGIFKLIYKGSSVGTVKVTILNSKNEAVFTEAIPKVASFMRPYNFSEQGVGDYRMIIEDKDGKIEKPISYTLNKVESMIDVSKIANAENKYLLSIENSDSDQIQVKILDNDKNILHEEVISVNGKFAVVYNLNKFKKVPTFEVAGSNGVWKTFTF